MSSRSTASLRRFRVMSASAPGLAAVMLSDAMALLCELTSAAVVPWWVTRDGGPAALAWLGAWVALATVIALPALSPLGDRRCKAWLIRAGGAMECAVCAAYAGCAVIGFRFAPVVACAIAGVVAAALAGPARCAILAELVAPPDLPQAIQWQKACRSAAAIVGPLLAATVLAFSSVQVGMLLCAALGAAAWAASLGIPRTHSSRKASRGWWTELRAGFTAKWQVPMERCWTAVNFVVWIFQGPCVGLLVPIKLHSLGLAGSWQGLALGALGVGTLVGSTLGSQALVRRFGRYRVRLGLGAIEGLWLAAAGLAPGPWPLIACLLAAGFCNASMALVGATHRALAIPLAYRVRLAAASSVCTQVAGTIGPALVAALLPHWGTATVYALFGLAMAASVTALAWVPRWREFLSLEHAEVVDWFARQYPAAFPGSGAGNGAASGQSRGRPSISTVV